MVNLAKRSNYIHALRGELNDQALVQVATRGLIFDWAKQSKKLKFGRHETPPTHNSSRSTRGVRGVAAVGSFTRITDSEFSHDLFRQMPIPC